MGCRDMWFRVLAHRPDSFSILTCRFHLLAKDPGGSGFRVADCLNDTHSGFFQGAVGRSWV